MWVYLRYGAGNLLLRGMQLFFQPHTGYFEVPTTKLTIDLPLPGSTKGGLVPGGCRGGHREVSDSAVTAGARPHPVARAGSSQSVALGPVSRPEIGIEGASVRGGGQKKRTHGLCLLRHLPYAL